MRLSGALKGEAVCFVSRRSMDGGQFSRGEALGNARHGVRAESLRLKFIRILPTRRRDKAPTLHHLPAWERDAAPV